jgi:uncharacterized protein
MASATLQSGGAARSPAAALDAGDLRHLSVADIELLASLDAEIILLGTGDRLRFPSPDLLRPLVRAQKGLEVMDLPAACRTYNVLMGEGRKVAVGLLLV